ncbi:MAG TPA: heat-inducible transcription repressor HrcA [Dehalococcoidia bacterium]|nr:heat-inducible transcription repressor HrcA [Dehalococcoidia bacterium]
MLSPRAETILKSIVGQYIVKAVPVPSQSIINDYELGVSSATIRNEMAHLEQAGYITRCHPSSGSVPCDKGYRYYVELLTGLDLPLAEQRLISHLFHQVEKEVEVWLRLAATLMARLAQNVAVVALPKSVNCRFKYVEVVALQDSLALVVLILRGARVKQQLATFDQVVSQPELTAIANKLNTAYSGLTSSQILAEATGLLPIEQQLTDCLVKIMQTEDEQEYDEPYLDGLHFMLNQPEFGHSYRVLTLMELIEHRNLLQAIIPPEIAGYGVQVVIGKENKAELIQDYSVVISRYGLPEEAVGVIGVVGPTRMPYARAISTVGYLSSVLSELVAELYGRETPTGLV